MVDALDWRPGPVDPWYLLYMFTMTYRDTNACQGMSREAQQQHSQQ